MDDEKRLKLIEDALEADPGELSPDTVLTEIDYWDSMAQLSFIAMMDDEFGRAVSGEEITKFKTVRDLMDAMV